MHFFLENMGDLFTYLSFFNVYLFLRQRETGCERGRGRERGRHRIGNRLQALSCQHRAQHGARTHGPRDHDLSRSRPLNQLSHPGAPIHSSFDGHLDCLHLLALVNNAAGTLVYKYLLESLLSVLLSKYPEVEFLDHMIILFSSFSGISTLFSIVCSHRQCTRGPFSLHSR